MPNRLIPEGLTRRVAGRPIVGKAIAEAYKPMFDLYPDAPRRPESDLVTFVKSHSNLDDAKAALAPFFIVAILC